jgi:phage gp16-like protein
VPHASSTRLAGANNYKVEDANHFTICRPPTKDHPSYSKLVECLKFCLKKQSKLPSLPKFEVGLDNIAMDMIKLLEKVSIIGLVGMGGIGKTTLSKKIYNLIYKEYDKCSYLEDVKSKHLRDVQKQLLYDLCDKDKDVNDDDLNNIKRFTTLKKVLVVIDDVGTTENLIAIHDLLVNGERENNKSKIIVTCRNWQILENHVNEVGKVDIKLLEESQAKNQKQLLYDLCDKDKDVNDDDLNNIKRFTTSKKVLVVIDDIGTTKNLIALHDLLVSGERENNKSKIIVTCRNWQILEKHVNKVGKVDIKSLEESQAKKLFMFHAYGVEEKMKPNFNFITDEIVKACDGLPLSIEVMGQFLKTKHCL